MPEAFCEFETVRKKVLLSLWVLWEKKLPSDSQASFLLQWVRSISHRKTQKNRTHKVSERWWPLPLPLPRREGALSPRYPYKKDVGYLLSLIRANISSNALWPLYAGGVLEPHPQPLSEWRGEWSPRLPLLRCLRRDGDVPLACPLYRYSLTPNVQHLTTNKANHQHLTLITEHPSLAVTLCELCMPKAFCELEMCAKRLSELCALCERKISPRLSSVFFFLTEEHRRTERTNFHRDIKSTDITERYS